MKAKGHKAFGLLLLVPILMGKTINYINIPDKYIRSINDNIYQLNEKLIDIQTILLYKGFSFYYIQELIFLMFFFFLGIKFPDIDLLLKNYMPSSISNLRYLYHRQFTHSILLVLFAFLVFNNNIYSVIFVYGILTHLIADMITGSVPLFFNGVYYKSFNPFTLRIGIDMFYIFTKPSFQKGSTKMQKIVEMIKNKIVIFFEMIGNLVILFFFLSLAAYKFIF